MVKEMTVLTAAEVDVHWPIQHQSSPTEQLLALLDGRRLSPAQRRIGQFLIDHHAEVVFMSSVDLAERVGVSQPSVTRFAAALGFTGYPDLREKLKEIVLGAVAADENGI